MVMTETMKRNRRAWRMRAMSAAAGGSTYADVLLGSYQNGLAIVARDNSMVIRDRSTFANNYSGTPGAKLTVTRASNATYWGSDGLLKTAANNVLRRDYDPRLSGASGYLVEEARTNLALQAQTYDSGTWVKDRTTVSANATTAPDGTTTADKIVEDSQNNEHNTNQSGITIVSATVYTLSVFAKAGERSQLRLQFYDGTTNKYPVFSLVDGSKVADNGIGSSWTATALSDGWWRFSITMTSASTSAAIYMGPAVGGVTSYQGNGSSGIYLWGAQLEAGAFATSYIPTTTATVTRAADAVSIATSAFPFSTTEGALYARGMSLATSLTGFMCALSDNTANERIGLRYATTNPELYVVDGGVDQAQIDAGTATYNALRKLAGRFKANDFAASYNGGAAVTDTSGTIPTPTALYIGDYKSPSVNAWNGWITELMYLPIIQSDAQLAALTT